MRSTRFRSLARTIYHRMPLSQSLKWRLRESLQPLLVSLANQSNFTGFMRGLLELLGRGTSVSALNRDYGREGGLAKILTQLAEHAKQFGPASHWIALPFLSTGGAEMVALNLSRALREMRPDHSVVLLITDRKLISEKMILPEGVVMIVFDDYLGDDLSYPRKQALLRDLLLSARPQCFHNINSEVAWHLILSEGERLKRVVKLYASIFAFQFAPNGQKKIGYAAYFLRQGIVHLSGLISDNQRFIDDATNEYRIEASVRSRMVAVYQPCRLPISTELKKSYFAKTVSGERPQILWAGRLDAEKRVDLFLNVVKRCDFADFRVFGQVVLDGDAPLPTLANLFYEGSFSSPLQWIENRNFDAFMFTSKWEGMPNILIEVGALGVPVIAPTVGGVGELITPQTGYPLPEQPTVDDYVEALRSVITNPAEAVIRCERLYELIGQRHSWAAYKSSLAAIPGYGLYLDAEPLVDLPTTAPGGGVNNAPTVSVIIPCYNQGRYLHESIASILAACHTPLEIIVIDDGSTDGRTDRFLADAVKMAPDVVFVHRQQNQGLSGTRNTGLMLARGEFVQFLDADDLLVPNKIDIQLSQFTTNPKLDVSITNFLLCDETRTTFFKPEEAIAQFELSLEDFLYRWERGFAIPIHCGLFRRRVLTNAPFDSDLRAKEDWVFWTKLVLNNVCFGYVHGYLAIYRQHDSSMCRSYFNMGRAWLQAGFKIEEMLNGREPLFFESVVSWFEQCYRSSKIYHNEVCMLQGLIKQKNDQEEKLHVSAELTPHSVPTTKKEVNAEILIDRLRVISQSVKPPLISVIVPVYNHYDYLDSCLGSLATQGNVSFEIICVDDASTDSRVSELMQLLTHRLPQLKVIIQTTNKGISETQNVAVRAAQGEFIAFLDCDDALEPGALEVIRKHIEGHPQIDYFFTDRIDVDRENKVVRTARYGGYETVHFSSQEGIREDLLDGMVASHLKVIRRSVYLEVGGCNPNFSGVQDWDLALKIAENYRLHYVEQALYRHRVHCHSVTRSELVAQFRNTNILRREFSQRWLFQDLITGREKDNFLASNVRIFSRRELPVPLETLKMLWRDGVPCLVDLRGPMSIPAVDFLRKFNSYFDTIYWDDPSVATALLGYLWDIKILHNKMYS